MRSLPLFAVGFIALACSSSGQKPSTGTAGMNGSSGAAGPGGSGGTSGVGGGAAGASGAAGGAAAGSAAAGATGAAGRTTAGTGGSTGASGEDGGAGGATSVGDGAAGAGVKDGGADVGTLAKFSFFETSLVAMRRLSGSQNGFGGDLRYGEADGLTGADKICRDVAESAMPGASAKGWHAFLSAAAGPGGRSVNAIDRIGGGPWYDRLGRLLALNKAALLHDRPTGANAVIINDLPNEEGVPNHNPDGTSDVDNHHALTGSDAQGHLYGATATCASWTSTAKTAGRPRIGFSWPESTRVNWISGQDEGGCGAGVNVVQTGGSDPNNPIVGSGGGYGGIYCFADVP